MCEKSIFLSSSFYSYIGKSTIQQNSNTSVLESPRSVPTRMRAAPASFAARLFLVGREEHRVAGLDAGLGGDGGLRLGGDEFGDRPLAGEHAVLLLEDDIAQPRRTLAPRPVVELVEEAARLRAGAGRGNRAHGLVLKRLETHIVASEDVATHRR